MTNKEKLKSAFNIVARYGFCGDCRWIFDSEECHEFDYYQNGVAIIKQALEKQIPKKPTLIKIPNTSSCKAHIRYGCPICGKHLNYGELLHCGECGQAIDWSEEE